MISPSLLLFSFRSCTAQKTLNASYATATSFPVSTLFLPRGRKREDPGNKDPLLVPSVHSLLLSQFPPLKQTLSKLKTPASLYLRDLETGYNDIKTFSFAKNTRNKFSYYLVSSKSLKNRVLKRDFTLPWR